MTLQRHAHGFSPALFIVAKMYKQSKQQSRGEHQLLCFSKMAYNLAKLMNY
jgi:hypothetical protein